MMKKSVSVVGLAFCLSAGTAMAASVPNRVIVKFKPSVLKSANKREALRLQSDILNSDVAAKDLGALTSVNLLTADTGVVRFATNMTPLEAARALRNVP